MQFDKEPILKGLKIKSVIIDIQDAREKLNDTQNKTRENK